MEGAVQRAVQAPLPTGRLPARSPVPPPKPRGLGSTTGLSRTAEGGSSSQEGIAPPANAHWVEHFGGPLRSIYESGTRRRSADKRAPVVNTAVIFRFGAQRVACCSVTEIKMFFFNQKSHISPPRKVDRATGALTAAQRRPARRRR